MKPVIDVADLVVSYGEQTVLEGITMKVFPDIENEPINARRRWRTRSSGQVVDDIKQELDVT